MIVILRPMHVQELAKVLENIIVEKRSKSVTFFDKTLRDKLTL